MAKNRKGTLPILLDLHYRYPINKFEEFYGDTISYSEIEQFSYIDLKEMVFEKINRGITTPIHNAIEAYNSKKIFV